MEESWLDVRIKNLGKQIISIVIDSVFLSLWVVIQYLVNLLKTKAIRHRLVDAHSVSGYFRAVHFDACNSFFL